MLSTVGSFIFCTVGPLGCQSRVAANKRFGNMTYVTHAPYIAEKVTLVDGTYEQHYERGISLYYTIAECRTPLGCG